uniref:Uncharacterized protein n=1 Tax=viral metagenome TaxID=1070528 RepID=A0A6C0ADU6_9ZZZZ
MYEIVKKLILASIEFYKEDILNYLVESSIFRNNKGMNLNNEIIILIENNMYDFAKIIT